MTDREKAIVMAYTGVTMLTGEKFSIFHEYIEGIMQRPVFTHELANKSVWDQIKEKSTDDFLRLCEEPERTSGEWLPNYTSQFRNPGRQCSICGKIVEFSENFCPNCGADMRPEHE